MWYILILIGAYWFLCLPIVIAWIIERQSPQAKGWGRMLFAEYAALLLAGWMFYHDMPGWAVGWLLVAGITIYCFMLPRQKREP